MMDSHTNLDNISILGSGSEPSPEDRSVTKIPFKLQLFLCYGALWCGAIIMLALENVNRLVIFNAYQSLFFSGFMTFVALFFTIFFGGTGFLSVMLITLAISLVLGYFAANSDTEIKLPILGDISDSKALSKVHHQEGII